VRTVRTGMVIGRISQVALLAMLAGTVGLGVLGWLVGIACGLTTNAALARGLTRSGACALGPANRITLARATLVGGVAALVADMYVRPAPVTPLVALAVVALALDAVDGWIARRTRTVSALGARFDMEVDAFLILVLSTYVARSVGPWVLAIGAARYAYVAVGWLRPWLREAVPARYWRKTVAAIQGIVLTVAAAHVLPGPEIDAALTVALVLLAESFGRDVWWLRRRSRVDTRASVERRRILVPARSPSRAAAG
jgi:phosphatidylglycerophosphate synthase